jgi:hypothetical protein
MTSPAFQTARQQGRLAPLKLEHAVLWTPELAPMLQWYLEVLQADVSFSSSSIAFLSYDEQNHRLALVVRPGTTRRDPNSAEEQHAWMRSAAFAQNPIGTAFDMDELAAQLKAGVPARQLVQSRGD